MNNQIWSAIRKASILVYEVRIKLFKLKKYCFILNPVEMGIGDKIKLWVTDLLYKTNEMLLTSLFAQKAAIKSCFFGDH